jgi:hypothetical protein
MFRSKKRCAGLAAMLTGALLAPTLLIACEKEGAAERAGKKVDKSVEKAGDKVKEAGDKIKDAGR